MTRMIAALLTLVALAWMPAQAQESDRALTQKAAKILKQLPEAERKAFMKRMAKLPREERKTALLEFVAKHIDKLKKAEEPSVVDQLEKMWKTLPSDQRKKMLDEAMKTLKDLAPKDRKELLEQYKKFNQALGGDDKKKKPAARKDGPKKSAENVPPLRRALRGLDDLLEKHGKTLDETLDQVEQVLSQARDYLELYRSMPKEQRDQVLKELEDGLKVFLEENVLPELESRVKGLKEAREAFSKTSGMLKEYLQAFKDLPEEDRKALINDVLEAGKLFVEETIKPEIEREVAKIRKRVEKRVRGALGKFLGKKDRKDRKPRAQKKDK